MLQGLHEEDALALFNLAEAVVWFVFGTGLLSAYYLGRTQAKHAVIAGAAFLLFGLSDLVETQTGTWFRPWWLLLSKVGCVVVLASTYAAYRRERATSWTDAHRPPDPS